MPNSVAFWGPMPSLCPQPSHTMPPCISPRLWDPPGSGTAQHGELIHRPANAHLLRKPSSSFPPSCHLCGVLPPGVQALPGEERLALSVPVLPLALCPGLTDLCSRGDVSPRISGPPGIFLSEVAKGESGYELAFYKIKNSLKLRIVIVC